MIRRFSECRKDAPDKIPLLGIFYIWHHGTSEDGGAYTFEPTRWVTFPLRRGLVSDQMISTTISVNRDGRSLRGVHSLRL